ncbi:restriction endonuclease subunit S [Capnocytophaga leadbetteri]
MTADQLRKSILQQAIQGKLVPQDPNDEPASVLLERIREEKARLVEEKKIKKEKNPSVIFRGEDNSYYEKFTLSGEVKCIDEEIPFEIPNGWEWCRLGIIGDWGAGATPLRGNIEYYGGKIPWLKTGELNNGLIISTEEYITDKALEECSLRLCNIGDILIAMYGATIGKLGIAGIKLTTNQACCACTPIFVYNKFLFYFLMASKQSFIEQGEGGAQPNISRIKLVNYLFPLPPLKEQQRIVEKIEELIPHIEHYDKAQTELDTLNKNIKEQLKKSVLQYAIEGKLVPQDETEGTAEELLLQIQAEKQKLYEENKLKKKDLEHSTIFKGEDNKYYEKIGKNVICIDEEIPFEIPNGWVWARMGQIADLYTGNSINEQEKKAQYMNTEGVPYIGTKDIGFDGKVLYQNGVAIPKKHLSLFKKAYSNSILICIEGGSAGRKITLIDKTVCFGNKLCCITSYYGKIRYLFYYLQSPMFFEIFNQNKNGIIGGVSVNNLKNLIVPLPPLAEQLRIVESIDAIFRCIES